jgi:type I restriction enzyme S subunit
MHRAALAHSPVGPLAAWRDCKLNDLLEIKHGYAFLGEHFSSAGTHIVLTPGSFYEEGGFKQKGDKEKWYNGPVPADYVLSEGDLIVAMTEQGEGLLGSSAIVPRSDIYLHNQRLGLVQIRDRRQNDPRFIYYLFNSKPVRQQIRASASGVKIRHTAPSRIGEVKVSVPLLPVQQRIAEILSAYDELIENNQRRIRILEEMAHTLYREWFVLFRIPGHEKTKLVSSLLGSIPEGWEVLEFRNLFEIRYGKTLPKTKIAEHGAYPVYGAGDVIGYYDKLLYPHKCVLVTSRGNGSGTVWRTREPAFVTNNSLIILPQRKLHYWDYSFIEQLLKHTNVMEAKTGSAQPQVTIENLNYVKAIVPSKEFVEKFCAVATPICEQVDALFEKCKKLRQTRDLLLPRLLSGQVDLDLPEAISCFNRESKAA